MCSAAKVMFVVIAADGWSYWQNERGRMGCPDWDALQWAFSAEQSIGHGRIEQPLLQERGGGRADLQFHATLLLRAALQS